MFARAHLAVDLPDAAFGIDDESMSLRKLERSDAHQRSVPACHLTAGVGQQGKREMLFIGEFPVTLDIVGAHTEERDAHASQNVDIVAKLTGLGGAARRVVLGVEIQHQPLSPVIGKPVRLAVLIQELEGGRSVARIEFSRHRSGTEGGQRTAEQLSEPGGAHVLPPSARR